MNGAGTGGTWTPALNAEILNHSSFSSVNGDYITLEPGEYQYEFSVYATAQNSTASCSIVLQVNDVTATSDVCNILFIANSGRNFVSVGDGTLSLKTTSTIRIYTASLSAGSLVSANANKSYLLLWRIQ